MSLAIQYRWALFRVAYAAAREGDRPRLWQALRALAGLDDIRGES